MGKRGSAMRKRQLAARVVQWVEADEQRSAMGGVRSAEIGTGESREGGEGDSVTGWVVRRVNYGEGNKMKSENGIKKKHKKYSLKKKKGIFGSVRFKPNPLIFKPNQTENYSISNQTKPIFFRFQQFDKLTVSTDWFGAVWSFSPRRKD